MRPDALGMANRLRLKPTLPFLSRLACLILLCLAPARSARSTICVTQVWDLTLVSVERVDEGAESADTSDSGTLADEAPHWAASAELEELASGTYYLRGAYMEESLILENGAD